MEYNRKLKASWNKVLPFSGCWVVVLFPVQNNLMLVFNMIIEQKNIGP